MRMFLQLISQVTLMSWSNARCFRYSMCRTLRLPVRLSPHPSFIEHSRTKLKWTSPLKCLTEYYIGDIKIFEWTPSIEIINLDSVKQIRGKSTTTPLCRTCPLTMFPWIFYRWHQGLQDHSINQESQPMAHSSLRSVHSRSFLSLE